MMEEGSEENNKRKRDKFFPGQCDQYLQIKALAERVSFVQCFTFACMQHFD